MFGNKRKDTGTARALLVTLTHIDPAKHNQWDGRNGCSGCGLDAEHIADLLRPAGYEITWIKDAEATKAAVLKALRAAAAATQPGDNFFFFYAGHGGQMPDRNGDEETESPGGVGRDETLVLFDAELIDDALDEVWLSFRSGTVIHMISDSCNSGTNYRGRATQGPSPIRPMARAAAKKMKARLLHMGGCRDGLTSAGSDQGGAFTRALHACWHGGRGASTWKDLHEDVCAHISGQVPQISTYGPGAGDLLQERPFQGVAAQGPEILTATRGSALEDAFRSGELTPTGLLSNEETRGAVELPIDEAQARQATRWLMHHFGDLIHAAGEGTPFTPEILTAIVCQETAYFWLPLVKKLEKDPDRFDCPEELPELILARCVLDASGDYPGTSRSAFPVNTAAFRAKYGEAFTNLLIAEANATRALRDYAPKRWVYKGYGIFQYDLQFVEKDPDFFRERRWQDFSACARHCVEELKVTYARENQDLWEAVRAYNGAGPAARKYRDNVKQFAVWTEDEISKLESSAGTRNTPRAPRVLMPSSKPKRTQAELAAQLSALGIDRTKHPLVIVGIRGYYRDTMGNPGVNDRGIYDDAIFIDSPDAFAAFNGNTDPSSYRPGKGFEPSARGRATLKPGVWYAYRFADHVSKVHGPYPAICQRLGEVTVIRDGNPPYEHTGADFGINIHKGGYQGTSSEGCQTIHPDQWPGFYALAKDLAQRYHGAQWNAVVIPYALIDESVSPVPVPMTGEPTESVDSIA